MPTVWIPAPLQGLTGGKSKVVVEGATIRDVVKNLDKMYPGIKDRLMDGFKFRGEINVFIDGAELGGNFLEPVKENSEIHFLPAIGGG